MQPLECFSDMNAIIVVWCFYTKFAVLRDSTPVVLSVNHFTCEMQGYRFSFIGNQITKYSFRIKKLRVAILLIIIHSRGGGGGAGYSLIRA